jgi:nickel/cobalt exporter
MEKDLIALCIAAASIGFFHTLFGPDHYLPFVMMSTARKWSRLKTICITVLCGIGHIASSVLLGVLGVALGIALKKLELIESTRGEWAAWALMAFGLAYFVWGLRRAYKNRPHVHKHFHTDGIEHDHTHTHHEEHAHIHTEPRKKNITPWVLFVIFVLGPCEPLIPMLMYPAAQSSVAGLVLVTAVFGIVTLSTMLAMVMIATWGINLLPLGRIERYSHALAGATICLCGAAIVFLGL